MSKPLFDRFKNIRSYTEEIFSPLKTEDYVVQSSLLTSPPKWSLGHTTWFFEVFVLANFFPNYKLYDERFPFLFNSYYNNAGDRVKRTNRGDLTRPTVKEVYSYRRYVNNQMLEFLSQHQDLITEECAGLIELGMQHEQQHQELFWTDLKFTLAQNPLYPKYADKLPFEEDDLAQSDMEFLPVEEGIYPIGHKGSDFCYDNELGRHKVYIHDFEIANRLITNEEYLEFMNDGGYANFNLWLDEAWYWVNENQIESPLYWIKDNNNWLNYTLTGVKAIQPKAFVKHISYYEAAAFAMWKGMRLPTEFEWEASHNKFIWGQRWEHTGSAYLAYPNFKIAKGAVGEYNGKFMVNQMVLRGSSVASSPEHQRYSYRNFFHPWERWQYAGIRLAK